jgi:hypothetical protein
MLFVSQGSTDSSTASPFATPSISTLPAMVATSGGGVTEFAGQAGGGTTTITPVTSSSISSAPMMVAYGSNGPMVPVSGGGQSQSTNNSNS